MPTLTYRDALNQALREEMQRDGNVFLMGEEVGVYQGAYKVSRGLLEEFGPMRVVDTPIAELGFAGIGVGAAMAGLRPVIEFMTWNFAVLALDQIVNSAAKILYESGGQVPIPIVFRGPNGAALQLAAQHSQAWDSWLSHIPGLKVVAPATPADAKGLLKAAIRDNNPVIVLEGEMLYNLKGDVPEGEHIVPIGRADVKRPGRDVTFVCHSKTVAVALKAAEQLAEHEGVSAEVLDLRSLRPLDEEAIVGSVARTNRAVVIEEGWPHAGIGAQVVDVIQREAFDQLDAPVLRVTQADVPMPYNKQLERLAKPSPDRVVAVIVSPGEAVGAAPAAAAPATPSGSGKRETGNVATVTAPAPVAVTPLPVAAAADATRVKASPLARRMAKEAGVDLKLVTGSGPGGRVVKKDLERAPSPGASAAPTATAPVTFPVSRVPFPERTGAAYDDVPLTLIRKTIAKRLAASLGPIPHFFLTTDVDMERASEAREALNKQLGDQGGGKVSFNDIIIKATAHALTKHPACNAWFQEDHIRYWNQALQAGCLVSACAVAL